MNPPPTPASPPSSSGSGSLELAVALSPRLLLFLAAWGAAACAAILDCAGCGVGGRVGLLAATAVAFAVAGARLVPLPGLGAVRGLRCRAGVWDARFDGAWTPVETGRALEVLRGGWWLQLRHPESGRCHWVWIDAARTPRGPYRALCRALRRTRAGGHGATQRSAGRMSTGPGADRTRRRSRRGGSDVA